MMDPSAAKSRLKAAGIQFQEEDGHLRVGDFLFWPMTGFWRTADSSRQGYMVRNLIDAVKASTATGATDAAS